MQNIIYHQLPTLKGVSASKCYLPNSKELNFLPITILDFLIKHFNHINQNEWQERFKNGLIYLQLDNHFIALTGDELYLNCQNKTLYYYRQLKSETKVPFDYQVIFENERFMVIDKPHFLTMTPTGNYVTETLLTRLKYDTGNDELTPIHRLDKETAGLVLFCKDKNYRGSYQALFSSHQIQKTYHAIAPYKNFTFPIELRLHLERSEPFYTMQVNSSKPFNSHTVIELLEIDNNKEWAKYELHPSTGKLHQLRVHLNYLNIPIKNDPYYPIVNHKADDDFNNPLQLLAKRLEFIDPINKEHCSYNSKQELVL